MKFYKFLGLFILSAAFLFLMTDSSYAAASNTLGGMITKATKSFVDFDKILEAFTFLAGLFMSISGIFKFKDHVDNPHQTPLSAGVKRFLAGGMFFSLPYMYGVLVGSLHGSSGTSLTAGARHGAPTGTGMDNMIYSFMADIYEPMTVMLGIFAYLVAVILLLVGISRLIKTAQDGPRGPTGLGTIMTFIVAGVLFSFGDSMAVFSESLFGSSQVAVNAQISTDVIKAADAKQLAPVIEAVMAFVMLVGYIAFIRGWLIMKEFADGQGNSSIAQALTFILGGTIAINLGSFVNILQESLGISTSGTISFH